MAQNPQRRGESRRQPRQQRPVQQGQRTRSQRDGASARHARPQQRRRSKAPLFIALFLLLAVVAGGTVFFVTRCQRNDAASPATQEVAQNTTQQEGQSTPASTTSTSNDSDKDASEETKKANAKADSWELTLVNKTHPLPEDWEVDLAEVSDGKYVDARIAEQFEQMLQDCRDAGYDDVFVNQAYRTHETQQEIWDSFYNQYLEEGYSEEEAEELTGESVAVPGTSEHELGLAADICSINFDEEYNGPIQTWLRENGHKYGFIQRYPEGKEDITGTKNENWHFRYVGVEAATEMYESGQVMEEYLGEVDSSATTKTATTADTEE